MWKAGRTKTALLALALLATIAAAISCKQIEGILPTPTYMPGIENPEYYSTAEIAEHYLRCLRRVEPRNGDLRWEAPVLATRFERADIIQRDCQCYVKYETVFGYPGDDRPDPARCNTASNR